MSGAGPLRGNTDPQRCFNGQMLGHQGFLLTAEQRAEIIKRDPRSSEVIHPYLNGVEVLTLGGAGERFVLDLEQMDQLTAAGFDGAFAWVREQVLPDRERKAEEGRDADGKLRPHHKGFLAHWWRLGFGRPEMLSVIQPLPRYLACAYVTKRPVFLFISREFRPSNLIQVFGFADDYSFRVLQSHAHWLWFITKCGKLNPIFVTARNPSSTPSPGRNSRARRRLRVRRRRRSRVGWASRPPVAASRRNHRTSKTRGRPMTPNTRALCHARRAARRAGRPPYPEPPSPASKPSPQKAATSAPEARATQTSAEPAQIQIDVPSQTAAVA